MDLGPLIVELQKVFDVYGPQTAINVIGENGLPFTITDVKVESSEGGNQIWLKVEEF